MSLVVNHNLMAANVARNLNSHYANLSNSTQRLSTGLRINSAADDAAGLAIRELQRADIAALHQGARNANDAISLIQVADGALQIIDEKLIRMKELAEQAATGTYDSTQRMMIESEYQAMASEITRIANATDFNGMKLLDGTLSSDEHNGSRLDSEGKMKIHFGTGNASAEDYYYIQINEATSEAFGVGDASTWEDALNRIVNTFESSLKKQINQWREEGTYTDEELEGIISASEKWPQNLKEQLEKYTTFTNGAELETLYNQFKGDSEVGDLRDLFKESIDDYDSVTYREQNKMQYALGHAAIRRAELFEFDDYSPASKIYSTVASAFKTITGNPLFTGEADVKGDIEYSTDAGTTVSADITSATAAQTEVDSAAPLADFLENAVTVANNSTVKSQIQAKLLENPTADFTITYTDVEHSINYTITCAQSGKIKTIVDGTHTYTAECDGQGDSGSFTYSNIKNVTDGPNTYQTTTAGNVITMVKGAFTFSVNTSGDIYSLTNSNGDTFSVTNNAGTHTITSMVDKSSNTLIFDGSGTTATDVFSLTDSAGNKFSYSGGNYVSMKDKDGNTLAITSGKICTGGFTAADIQTFTDASGNVINVSGGKLASIQYGTKNYQIGDGTDFDLTETNPIVNIDPKTITDTETGNIYTFNNSGVLASAKDSLGNDITTQTLGVEGLLESVFGDAAEEAESRTYAGFTVATQEDAQNALVAISDAIEAKDKIRARLGALQNRLENTISNLNIQAENLQAAESRISDVDVSTEMTEFVRQQILTQSAVAMLSQANSLPQMAMQLIGG